MFLHPHPAAPIQLHSHVIHPEKCLRKSYGYGTVKYIFDPDTDSKAPYANKLGRLVLVEWQYVDHDCHIRQTTHREFALTLTKLQA